MGIAEVDVPDEFICPITNEIMKHPLMSIHGFSFERDAILQWLRKHSTCPLSRKELTVSKLVNNHALATRIHAWCNTYDMIHLLETEQEETEDDEDAHCMRIIGYQTLPHKRNRDGHTRRSNMLMRLVQRQRGRLRLQLVLSS